MKTTLNLDDQLMRTAKKIAAERGITLTRVIEEAIRAAVSPPPVRDERTPFTWRTVKGRKPPELDIADRDALYARMEARS
jgi:hypothetical protein